jgi:anthranilate phosphoribosyltransferase
MIETAIAQLTNQENLDFTMSQQVITEIMKGQATDAQIGSFLTALAIKKATIDEIAGAATAMRSQALPFKVKRPTLEIVGTGGDRSNSFNISTTTALVVAAAGVPVTKHGNRAASSKSGAADVLEALGIKIDLTPAQSLALLERTNFAFMYAREYHQAMRFVAPARQQIKIPTIFNILGPLANPAHAEMQLLGVYRQALMAP